MTCDEQDHFSNVSHMLPQGLGFQVIDKVVSYERGHILVARSISGDDPVFRDHFPSEPIYPGVLIIEMMAQASSVLGRLDQGQIKSQLKEKTGRIAAVHKVQFLKEVVPDMELLITSTVLARVGQLVRYTCKVYTEDHELISDGDLSLARAVS